MFNKEKFSMIGIFQGHFGEILILYILYIKPAAHM